MTTNLTAERAANDNAAMPANDNALNALAPAPGAIPTELEMQNVTREIALDDDEAATGWRGLLVLLLVSASVHVAVFGGLGRSDHHAQARARKRPTEVSVTVKAPPPAPKPPEAKPAPKTVAHKIAARAPAPPPPDAPPPPPPQAETPADFSGTTLTNDGPGEGWASAVGNGEAMHGPIGRPGAKVTNRAQENDGAAKSPVKAAPVVALASLSRPPSPPDLNDALERNYPAAARKQGTPGQAVLKARISAEGQVRDMVIVSQSAAGFGDACRATLRDSKWSPPLDKDGEPVSTFISYTCRFEVR